MTNWAASTLHVTGPERDIQEFATLVEKSRDWNEDAFVHLLSAIRQMPDELRGICMGKIEIDGKRFERWFEATGDSKARGITEWEQNTLRYKYDAADWYEWRDKNWGPRYGMDFQTRMRGPTQDGLWFEFDTPYRPPVEMLSAISAEWPTLTFDISYSIESGDAGEITIRKGRSLSEASEGVWDQPLVEIFPDEWEAGGESAIP